MTTSSPDDLDGFDELIAMYISEMPARIDSIRNAVTANDRDLLKRLLHQLVGSAGSYGFDSLSIEARKIELALGNNASVDDVSSNINGILELCKRATAE